MTHLKLMKLADAAIGCWLLAVGRKPRAEIRKPFPQHTKPTGRRSRLRYWPLLVLAVAALGLGDNRGWLLVKQTDELGTYHGRTFVVVSILSGDVIEIDAPDTLNGRSTTQVRLWGIRAPSPPRPGREGEPMWADAMAHASSLVLHQEVHLTIESHRRRDPLGRLLAHVTVVRDGTTLNESMLRAGLAASYERWPHMRLTAYAQAENRASRGGIGIHDLQ